MGDHPSRSSFSDGDTYGWNIRKFSPVEMVPTPGKIPFLNRCFVKIPDLTRKKPCILAGFENAQKKDNLQPVPVVRSCPEAAVAEILQGTSRRRKWYWNEPENGEIFENNLDSTGYSPLPCKGTGLW
ncbi:hypothetical protein [Methanoregula sp.]|uniref:hypothetical protein n=1 Tax=Methanoregula sp. TaxID=2052170 RepID=UPI003C76638E